MKKRVEWVDMAKGVGIIAIVLGHAIHPLTGSSHALSVIFASLYWWHVPLFIIIGGFFIKPIERTWQAFWAFAKKRIFPNVVTYLTVGTLLVFTSHVLHNESWKTSGMNFLRMIYGGAAANGEWSIFWFMTVYVVTVLVVVLLISYVKSIPMQFLITMVMFGIGTAKPHFHFFQFKYMPWSIDAVLLTSVWMLAGYYGYKYYPQLKNKAGYATAGVLIFLACFIKKYTIGLNFMLYLRQHKIHTPFMAFFVPIAICLAIFIICEALSKTDYFRWLLPLGQYSLAIMYFHKLVFDIVAKVPVLDHAWAQFLFGLIVPALVAALYRRIRQRWWPKQA